MEWGGGGVELKPITLLNEILKEKEKEKRKMIDQSIFPLHMTRQLI